MSLPKATSCPDSRKLRTSIWPKSNSILRKKDILDSYIIIDSSKELILNQIVDYIIKKYPTSDVFEDECGWSFYTEYSAEQILNEKLILLGKAFRYHQTITNGGK